MSTTPNAYSFTSGPKVFLCAACGEVAPWGLRSVLTDGREVCDCTDETQDVAR